MSLEVLQNALRVGVSGLYDDDDDDGEGDGGRDGGSGDQVIDEAGVGDPESVAL